MNTGKLTWERSKDFICSAVILFSSCFMVQIPVFFTNSGVLNIFPAELLGIIAAIYILIYFFRNQKTISREHKYFVGFTLLFTVYCVIVYMIRTLTAGLELKSILIFESNLFVIGFFYLVLFGKLSAQKVVRSLTIFSVVLGLSSVVLFYLIDYPISNQILMNHATRTFLLGMLLPVTAFDLILSKKRFIKVFFYIHLSTLVYCGVISGARLNYVFIPLLIIGVLFLLIRRKMLSIPWTLLSFVVSLSVIFGSAPFHLRTYAQLSRLSVTSVILKTCNITPPGMSNNGNAGDDLNNFDHILNEEDKVIIQGSEDSTSQSTSIRFFAWQESMKDVKKNIFFGIGLQQYEATSSDGKLIQEILPHNFVLEYVLSFGIVGFLLWGLMVLAPIFLAFRKAKFRLLKNSACFCTLLSIVFAAAGAFFQPYFVFPCVMTIVYLLLGCYYQLILQEVRQEEETKT